MTTPSEILYTSDSGNGTYTKMIDFRGPSTYNPSYINDPVGNDPVIEEAYWAMQPYVGVNEATMMKIHRKLIPYLLEQAYVINSPAPSM